MLGFIVRHLLRLIYRVELRGREHYDAAGPRTLILYNPGSIIDPLLLAAMLQAAPYIGLPNALTTINLIKNADIENYKPIYE